MIRLSSSWRKQTELAWVVIGSFVWLAIFVGGCSENPAAGNQPSTSNQGGGTAGTTGTAGSVASSGTGGTSTASGGTAGAGFGGAQTAGVSSGGTAGNGTDAGSGGEPLGGSTGVGGAQPGAGTAGTNAGSGGAGGGGGNAGSGGESAGSGGVGGESAGGSGGESVGGAGGSGGEMAFNPCPDDGSPCKIMPLGDSITDGVGSSGGGYRVDLFRRALMDDVAITFVGSNMNGPNMVGGEVFPRSHEGYSGYTIEDGGGRNGIAPLLDDALSNYEPHIITLMIGTNDVDINLDLQNAPTRLGRLLDSIIELRPDALLVVAQIVPSTSDNLNNRIETYNAAIPELVQSRADMGKHVTLVDMYSAFTDEPSYKTAYMDDRLHPSDEGYVVMAGVWYEAISEYLSGAP